jgi:hypothetical protein
MPITLVVPTSLQMGWVESPPYFCAATETARDIASDYCDTPVGSLSHHKFAKHVTGAKKFNELPSTSENRDFFYALEVYVDDFMSIVIPTSREQLEHVAMAIMTGIHDVFPTDIVDSNDLISEKKLLKGEGQYTFLRRCLVLILTASKRQCGWKKRNVPSSSPSSIVGFELVPSTVASRSENSNR